MTTTRQDATKFSSFAVTRCIRVDYENDVVYRTIHPMQDEAVLSTVANLNCFDESSMGMSLVSVEADGVDGMVVASVNCEAYDIAHGSNRSDITLTNGEYAGIYWRILGFVGGDEKFEDSYQMMVGDHEETIRAVCAGLQSLVSLPAAIRHHMDNLSLKRKAPNGDDYNELIALAGV